MNIVAICTPAAEHRRRAQSGSRRQTSRRAAPGAIAAADVTGRLVECTSSAGSDRDNHTRTRLWSDRIRGRGTSAFRDWERGKIQPGGPRSMHGPATTRWMPDARRGSSGDDGDFFLRTADRVGSRAANGCVAPLRVGPSRHDGPPRAARAAAPIEGGGGHARRPELDLVASDIIRRGSLRGAVRRESGRCLGSSSGFIRRRALSRC